MGDLLLVALFLGMLLWVGWPVTLWAGCAVGVAYGARRAAGGPTTRPGARAVADVLVGIAIGLGAVWLVQVAATGFAAFASGPTLRAAERGLSAAHASLGRLVHPAVFVASIALGLALRGRSHASRVGEICPVVASILFFGAHAERAGEVRWVASRRGEASGDLRALRAAQTRLVATAEVKRRIDGLSAEGRSYLGSFVRSSEDKRHRLEIVAEKAERLAAHTREPAPRAAGAAPRGDWVAVARCDAWLRASEAEGSGLGPTFDELDALMRVSEAVRAREADARSSMDAFASALVEATAKRWTDTDWGGAVWDLASAERLVVTDGPQEPWPVATSELSARSAAAEVDASELNFELGEPSAYTGDVPGVPGP
jgi:hypothetical protein